MSVTLINGDGNPKVLASQDADWYGALTGQTTCIVPINDNLGATIADSNTIEISSGVCITKEGRRVQIDEGDIEEIIIPTGTQGVDTYYIIGFHLYINELGQQVAETFVETMASATDTITETTFKEGSSSIYVSLYRVKRSGLLMDSVTRIIPILRTIAELDNTLGTTDISAIGDGTVTGGISQINSDLTNLSEYESGTVQRQNGTIGVNSLKRCGNTVNIVFSVSGNTTPIVTSVGVVPSAFRPAHDKFGVLTFASGASFVTTLCKIATNGAITCPFASSTTAPDTFFLAFEYNLG